MYRLDEPDLDIFKSMIACRFKFLCLGSMIYIILFTFTIIYSIDSFLRTTLYVSFRVIFNFHFIYFLKFFVCIWLYQERLYIANAFVTGSCMFDIEFMKLSSKFVFFCNRVPLGASLVFNFNILCFLFCISGNIIIDITKFCIVIYYYSYLTFVRAFLFPSQRNRRIVLF